MRIVLILTSFTSGGAETLVCNLAEYYAAAGHGVSVIALSDAASIGNDPQTEASMIADLGRIGVVAHVLGPGHRRNPLRAAIALRPLVAALHPDLIHSHSAAALPALAFVRGRVPVILTHHNSRLSFPPWAYRAFDRIVAGYVAISDQCAAQTAALARRPIRKILNAASPLFAAATPRTAPRRDPVILAVGTASAQKDYPTLIRAAHPLAERLGREGRHPRIRIAGGGALLGALRTLAESEGAGELVELLGERRDVDELMRSADLFANTSRWEGLPIAMIEATMSALPVVATDVAGNREMVVPGVNGALVPAGAPDAMAAAMAEMLSDDRNYARLSAGALASAARFSIAKCGGAHLSLYRDAVAGRLSPRAGFAPDPAGQTP